MGFGMGTGAPLASTPPNAQYDEQLGTTFTQNFASLAYNVTALAQGDTYGYGPSYLLNGLSSKGYWYQVGVSYHWPLVGAGFSQGFDFNYEVFNSNGVSVFPANGGGLAPFTGTVNPGDTIGLALSFSGVNVLMSARDYSTGATASASYSAQGATIFDGSLSSTSNSNGFFSGLMTEWYHVAPYYSSEGHVTYSSSKVTLSSAWLWIDEYDPGNQSWTGSFSVFSAFPQSYSSASSILVPFSSHNAAEEGDASEFATGTGGSLTTSITLVQAASTSALTASNSFEVYYTKNGQASTAFAQSGTLSLTTDAGSPVSISSVSTGSTPTERWVLDSQGGNVTVATGSTVTFYYYDLLLQPASYATSDGSPLSNLLLDYHTAPTTASSQSSLPLVGLFLQASTQPIWAARGSQVSIVGQISGKSGEQWSLPTSQWTISSADQIPSPILYYHQFYVTPGYTVKGGTSASGTPTVTCAQYGTQISVPIGSSNWVDSGLSCNYSPTLPGSTQGERWAVPSATAAVSQPGAVSLAYIHQYSLGITYSITGGSPNPPTVTGVSFGTSGAQPLQSSPATVWLDAGSPYSISNPLSSSSTSERWETTGTTSGTLQGQAAATYVFYHQFLMTASFSVTGGAPGATAPGLSYTSFGSPTSIQLTGTEQTFWADGGVPYSVPQTLTGSSSTERWYTENTQGTVQASSSLSFGYTHQFLLSVTGAAVSTQWYNSSSTAQVSVPGISARASGSGERVTSYSIDGALTTVKPTTGTVSMSIPMNAAHQLSINSVQQYQVTLDASATAALSSITTPTIAGDSHWYDQGTSVTLTLKGVWNRTAGAGLRLISYSVNGVQKGVSTTGTIDALSAVPISSPETVTAAATVQYRLTAGTGSIETGTAASIPGDAGWYDNATSVTVTYYYTWNSTTSSRYNAVGYAISGIAGTTQIARSGSGAFPVHFTMVRPETITIDSVTQYMLVLSPGQDISLSATSPTHDDYFDSGTTLTATTDYTWDVVNNNTRENLVSFTLDSVVTNITSATSGSFTTPAIIFNGPQTLSFSSVTQDLVILQFTDGSGASTIVPTSVQIQLGNSSIASVPPSGVWLDNGVSYQLYKVEWEGSDVKPSAQALYTVAAPVDQNILGRVYSGSVTFTDYLGLPISGAKVSVALANGTTITMTTDSKGTINLREIPIGTYTASISYLGATTIVDGNAAQAGAVHTKVFASYPTLVLIVLAAAIVIIAVMFVSPGRRLRKAIPPDSPAQHLTQLCSNCGATLEMGSLHCPECGAQQV
jgi:hypothetical protein